MLYSGDVLNELPERLLRVLSSKYEPFDRIILDEMVEKPSDGSTAALASCFASNYSIRRFCRRIWREALQDYANRRLAKEEDRVIAIAGIATAMEKLFNYRYLAGLRSNDLPVDLL
jgi:hypothetical protein